MVCFSFSISKKDFKEFLHGILISVVPSVLPSVVLLLLCIIINICFNVISEASKEEMNLISCGRGRREVCRGWEGELNPRRPRAHQAHGR